MEKWKTCLVLILVFILIFSVGEYFQFKSEKKVYQKTKELQQKIKKYQQEIELLKEELEKTKIRKQKLIENLTLLKGELSREKSQIEVLEKELKDSQTKIQQIQEDLRQRLERPWTGAAVYVFLLVPRTVGEEFYSQNFENLSLTFSVNPSGISFYKDEFGNNYTVLYWNEKPKSNITLSIESDVTFSIESWYLNYTAPHPYPLNDSLIPEDIKIYLQPTANCPSNESKIIRQAKNIIGNLTDDESKDESKIVDAVVSWVYFHIKVKEPDEKSELKETNYAISLLRGLGIPARLVLDTIVYPYCPFSHKVSVPHYRIHVWYPKLGWVPYRPALPPPEALYLPLRGYVEFWVGNDVQQRHEVTNAHQFIEFWSSTKISVTRAKIQYTLIIFP